MTHPYFLPTPPPNKGGRPFLPVSNPAGRHYGRWSDVASPFDDGLLGHRGGVTRAASHHPCSLTQQEREGHGRVRAPHLLHARAWRISCSQASGRESRRPSNVARFGGTTDEELSAQI